MKVKRGPFDPHSKAGPLKKKLHRAGVTYRQVALAADVTERMVKFVIDGERTSAPVMEAIRKLTAKDGKQQPAA